MCLGFDVLSRSLLSYVEEKSAEDFIPSCDSFAARVYHFRLREAKAGGAGDESALQKARTLVKGLLKFRITSITSQNPRKCFFRFINKCIKYPHKQNTNKYQREQKYGTISHPLAWTAYRFRLNPFTTCTL